MYAFKANEMLLIIIGQVWKKGRLGSAIHILEILDASFREGCDACDVFYASPAESIVHWRVNFLIKDCGQNLIIVLFLRHTASPMLRHPLPKASKFRLLDLEASDYAKKRSFVPKIYPRNAARENELRLLICQFSEVGVLQETRPTWSSEGRAGNGIVCL